LSPPAADIAGMFGELFFPIVLGLFGRVAAVVSYWHVPGSEGYEAGLAQHLSWKFMILVLVVFGPGAMSLDHLAERRVARA
jgi:putative oxidoreductase